MISKRSASGLCGAEARGWWRENRRADIDQICTIMGLRTKWITPYQCRVNGAIDFYPTNGRYHILKSNKRGDYHTGVDLINFLERNFSQ